MDYRKWFAVLFIAMASMPAFAQNQGNVYHYVTVTDEQGKEMDLTSLAVYNPGTTDLATIYSDADQAKQMTNPITPTSTYSTVRGGLVTWYGGDGWNYQVIAEGMTQLGSISRVRDASDNRIVVFTMSVTDAELAALAALVSDSNMLPYFTGSGTAALLPFSPWSQTLISALDANDALTYMGWSDWFETVKGTASAAAFAALLPDHVYDVRDYGSALTAVPIQAAIDAAGAAGGGIVYIPPGHYEIDAAIRILDVNNIIVRGAGQGITTLHTDAQMDHSTLGVCGLWGTFFADSTTHTSIKNITIEHMSIDSEALGYTYPSAEWGQNVISIGLVDGMYIRDNHFSSNDQVCIFSQGHSPTYGPNNVVVERNVFDNQGTGDQINFNTQTSLNTFVRNNYFNECRCTAVHNMGAGGIVSGNIFYRCEYRIVTIGEGQSQTTADAFVVSDNVFVEPGYNGSQTTMCILVLGTTLGPSGYPDQHGVLVTNNQIYNLKAPGYGIVVAGNATIEGNLLSGVTDANTAIAIKLQTVIGTSDVYPSFMYLKNNVIEDTANAKKWLHGIQIQADPNNDHISLYCSNNYVGDIANYADEDSWGILSLGAVHPKLYLSGDIINGRIIGGTGALANVNGTGQWNNKPIFANNQGTIPTVMPGGYIRPIQQENAATDNVTIVVESENLDIVASNGEAAEDPNVTISEANAVDGQVVYISLWKDSVDSIILKDIDGQVELIGDTDLTMTKASGVVQLMYTYDRWQQVDSSSGSSTVSDASYGAGWDTVDTVAPSKNTVYDQMETRQKKLVYDVRDYGALVDGVTNDATAIQALITASLPGTTIVIPGTCKIGSAGLTITGKTGLTIRGRGIGGDGFVFSGTPSTGGCVYINDSNDIHIVGLDIDANNATCAAFSLHDTERITIERCIIHDTDKTGDYSAIRSDNGLENKFIYNTVYDCGDGILPGIIETAGQHYEKRCLIKGNVVHDVYASGIGGTLIDSTVSENWVWECNHTGIDILAYPAAITGMQSNNVTVEKNVCFSNVIYGIRFDTTTGGPIRNIRLIGNWVYGNGTGGISLDNGIDIDVTGNYAYNNESFGIAAGGTTIQKYAFTANHTFDNRSSPNETQDYGIRITPEVNTVATDITFTGNIADNNQFDIYLATQALGLTRIVGVVMVGNYCEAGIVIENYNAVPLAHGCNDVTLTGNRASALSGITIGTNGNVGSDNVFGGVPAVGPLSGTVLTLSEEENIDQITFGGNGGGRRYGMRVGTHSAAVWTEVMCHDGAAGVLLGEYNGTTFSPLLVASDGEGLTSPYVLAPTNFRVKYDLGYASSYVVDINGTANVNGDVNIPAGKTYQINGVPLAGGGNMSTGTYDVAANGFVDGNNTAYGSSWNGKIDAPSMDAVYDKIETLAGGHDAVTLADDANAVLALSAYPGQAIGLDTQTANYVFAGPTTGAAADPAFRALVAADIPTPLTSTTSGTSGGLTAGSLDSIDLLKLTGTVPDANTAAVANGDTKHLATGDQIYDFVTGLGYSTVDNMTEFLTQTNWSVFYSDGSGDVKELTLGADGTYLKSNGATSAPTWATPAGAPHDAVTLTGLADDFLTLSTQAIDVNQAGTLASNPVLSANQLIFGSTGILFEGATKDAFETLLTVTDPTADRTITMPNASGTVAVSATAPATLSAAGDVGVTVAKDIVTTSPLAGGTDDVLPGADSDVTLSITMAKDIVAGAGLTGGEDNVLPGADADTTISIDYTATLAADPAIAAGNARFSTTGIIFEGSTADAIETLITVTDPTSTDKTITFPNATGTVAVSVTTPITLSAAGDVGITVAKDIVAGVGISGGEDNVLPGADADTTLTFAPAELEAVAWGGGAQATIVHTFDVSGTDTTMTYGSGVVTASGDITATGDLTATGSDVTIGAAGVKLTGDGDGALTVLGLGDGSDENLIINLDDTANEATITSGTGVILANFSEIPLRIGYGNGDADVTQLTLCNSDPTSGSETAQTASLLFQMTGTINESTMLPYTAAEIEAYKISDWYSSGTADLDSGLKFYTTNNNTPAVRLTLDNAGLGTFTGGVTAGGTVTSSGTFDVTGATGMVLGSADVTGLTVTTDGTGNGELTLPADSIGDADIDWGTGAGQVSAVDMSATLGSLDGLTETNGGIAYGTADNAYAWLAAGTANYLLQGNGAAAPTWTAAPTVSAANMTSFPTLNQTTSGTSGGLTAGSLDTIDLLKLTGTLPDANTASVANGDTKHLATGDQIYDFVTGLGYSTVDNMTEFLSQTNWSVFYSDGSGDVKELTLGADGTYLKSNGATSAPTWATPSGAAHDAVTLTGLAADFLTLATQAIDVNQAGTLASNPVLSANQLIFGSTGILFEGATADAYETLLTVTDPTADRTITMPNASGTVAVSATGPITLSAAGDIGAGATLVSLAGLTETNGGIPYGTADNAYAWLGAGAEGTLLMGNGAGAPSFLAAGATTTILVGGGAADPVWTTATGTGAPVRAGTPTFTTSAISPIWQSGDADTADAGAIRLGNAETISWEANPASTDITLTVDSSEIMQASGTFNATTLTEGAVGVPNTGDKLSVFAATTSAELAGVLSNETGTGNFVMSSDPTITDANLVTAALGTPVSGTLSNCDIWGTPIPKTASYNIPTGTASGLTYTNTGASAAITITLQPGTVGMKYRFICTVDYDISLDPNSAETFYDRAAGEVLRIDDKGCYAEIRCIETGKWAYSGADPNI